MITQCVDRKRRTVFLLSALFLSFASFSTHAYSGLPRIAVVDRGSAGEGRFVVAGTGADFVPRGVNYVKLRNGNHATFGSFVYNDLNISFPFFQLRRDGYNVLRVFIQFWPFRNESVGQPFNENGLNSTYMNNVADFIMKAATYNLYTILVLDYFPQNSFYGEIRNRQATEEGYLFSPTGLNYNAMHMSQGHIDAKAAYVTNFINSLKARVGEENMSNVMAYSIENEMFFRVDLFPFNQSEGYVKTASGISFDMGDADNRQQAADVSAVHYANVVTEAIKQVDPEALVTTGMFTYNTLGLDGPDGLLVDSLQNEFRRPVRPSRLSSYSALDYVSMHFYPSGGTTYALADDFASQEYDDVIGPVLMDEFGAFTFQFTTVFDAALAMRQLQRESCQYKTAGWLFWTFDADQQFSYDLTDNFGAINFRLAPIIRPDPCN